VKIEYVSACYALLGEYVSGWRKAVYTSAWDRHTSTNLWLTKSHYFAAQTSAKLSFFYWRCITSGYLDLGIYADADTRVENDRKKCRRHPPDSQRSTVSDVARARVARGVACPDAARLRMSARPTSASPTSVGSRRRLRSATTLDLLAVAPNFHYRGDRAFTAVTPAVWNSLPEEVRSSTSLQLFWRRLKAHSSGVLLDPELHVTIVKL